MSNEFKVVGHAYSLDKSDSQNPNMLLLNHAHLDNDPVYRSLKTDLETYYKDSGKPSDRPAKNVNIKSTLYSSLHSLLSEVTFTKDTKIQKEMLKTVHNWYTKKKDGRHKLPQIKRSDNPEEDYRKTVSVQKSPIPPTMHSSHHSAEQELKRYPSPYLSKQYQSEDLGYSTMVAESLDKKYLSMRGLDFSSSKEAENRNKVIFAWGSEKSRASEEFVRKIDQSRMESRQKRSETPAVFKTKNQRFSSIPSNRALLYDFSTQKPPAEDPEEPEDKLNLSRVYKLRQAHASLIDIDSENQQPKKRKNESSMSIYRQKADSTDNYPARAKSTEKFNEQLEEVILVKKKLASKNIPCSIKHLINGLVLAGESERSKSPEGFPRGGEYLISNPLSKLKQKKKKKKKKKGKKAKK